MDQRGRGMRDSDVTWRPIFGGGAMRSRQGIFGLRRCQEAGARKMAQNAAWPEVGFDPMPLPRCNVWLWRNWGLRLAGFLFDFRGLQ